MQIKWQKDKVTKLKRKRDESHKGERAKGSEEGRQEAWWALTVAPTWPTWHCIPCLMLDNVYLLTLLSALTSLMTMPLPQVLSSIWGEQIKQMAKWADGRGKAKSETVPGESGGKMPGKCGFSLIQKCKHRRKNSEEEIEDKGGRKKNNNNNQNRVKNHAHCQPKRPSPLPQSPLHGKQQTRGEKTNKKGNAKRCATNSNRKIKKSKCAPWLVPHPLLPLSPFGLLTMTRIAPLHFHAMNKIDGSAQWQRVGEGEGAGRVAEIKTKPSNYSAFGKSKKQMRKHINLRFQIHVNKTKERKRKRKWENSSKLAHAQVAKKERFGSGTYHNR